MRHQKNRKTASCPRSKIESTASQCIITIIILRDIVFEPIFVIQLASTNNGIHKRGIQIYFIFLLHVVLTTIANAPEIFFLPFRFCPCISGDLPVLNMYDVILSTDTDIRVKQLDQNNNSKYHQVTKPYRNIHIDPPDQKIWQRPCPRMTPKATKEAGGKKRTKRTEYYSPYIYKVLKQVHPDNGISNKGMPIAALSL